MRLGINDSRVLSLHTLNLELHQEYQRNLRETFVNPHFYIFAIPADPRALLPAMGSLLSHPLQRADRLAVSHTLAPSRGTATVDAVG